MPASCAITGVTYRMVNKRSKSMQSTLTKVKPNLQKIKIGHRKIKISTRAMRTLKRKMKLD